MVIKIKLKTIPDETRKFNIIIGELSKGLLTRFWYGGRFTLEELLDNKSNIINSINEVESFYDRKLLEKDPYFNFYKGDASIASSDDMGYNHVKTNSLDEAKKLCKREHFGVEYCKFPFKTEDSVIEGHVAYNTVEVNIVFDGCETRIRPKIYTKIDPVGLEEKDEAEYLSLKELLKSIK
jgi:hypothetical protein